MAKVKSSTRERVIKVDFSKEEGGGGRFRVPEGDYKFKIVAVKSETSKADNPMLVIDFEGVEGKVKGKKSRDYFTLTPKSLWKLRGLLEAIGMNVPKKMVQIPVKRLLGKEVGMTLVDDEYEGKISSKPSDYIDLETLAAADTDEEEDEDEDEDEEEEDEDEDVEDLDLDEDL